MSNLKNVLTVCQIEVEVKITMILFSKHNHNSRFHYSSQPINIQRQTKLYRFMLNEEISDIQGVPIKMRLGFSSIALAILIQQDLDYILLKTDIHSFVSNTETFLSDIWKPRYRFPKFQFQNW